MPDIDIIIKAQDRASGSIKNVNRELGHLDDHGKRLPAPLRALSSALGVGLKVAAIGAAAALVGLGVALKNSIGAAIDMEQSVADIMAVMGKAAPPVEELNKAIQDLGLDPKLKVSATEAASAINMLAKNGITWDEISTGMARSTVLLANATNDDFALAADVATNAMVNFNKDAGDMEDVINGIIGVTQASQFDINDYALAIAQAGGVAGAVGVDFDDFNAVIAATSSSFSSGSDAGTSFKVFLQRLVPDTAPAMDAMRELGLLTEEGGNAFFTASGEMKSMSEIAELLQNATAGLSEEQKIQTMTTIFGTDAQRTAFALAAAGAETIDSLKAAIGDVSAEEAAATRMDTLKGSWEIFLGVVETLSIQLGTVFLPVARDLVEWATKMATEHGPKVIEWANNLAAAIQNFLPVLMNFVTNELPNWRTRWDDWAAAAWKWITEKALPAVLGKLGEWGAAVLGWVTTNLPAWTTKLGEWAVAAWQWIVDVTPTVVAKLGEWGAALWGWITTNAPTWATKLGEFAAKSWDWVKNEVIPKAGEKLGEWLAALGQWVISSAPSWATSLSEFATKAWDWLTLTVIPTVGTKLGEWATALYTWATDPANLKTWATKLSGWATAAWQWIVDAAGKVGGYLGDWYIALSTWVGTNLPLWVAKLGEWAKAAWQWIVDAAKTIPEKIAIWWTATKKWFDDHLPVFIAIMLKWRDALVQWVTDATPKTTVELGNWWLAVSGWFLKKFPDFEVGLVKWTTGLVTWIGNAISGAINGISAFVVALVSWMIDPGADKGLGGINSALKTWTQAFIDWFVGPEGLITRLVPEWAKLGTAVREAILKIGTEIDNLKTTIVAAFAALGAAAVQGFIDGLGSLIDAAKAKAAEMAAAAAAAVGITLEAQSPSKVFHRHGENAGQGFINGMNSKLEQARQAAASLAQAASTAVQNIMSVPYAQQTGNTAFVGANVIGPSGMITDVAKGVERVMAYAKTAKPGTTEILMAAEFRDISASIFSQVDAAVTSLLNAQRATNATQSAAQITDVMQGAQRILEHWIKAGELPPASWKSMNIADDIESSVDKVVKGVKDIMYHWKNAGQEILDAHSKSLAIDDNLEGTVNSLVARLKDTLKLVVGAPAASTAVAAVAAVATPALTYAQQSTALYEAMLKNLGIHSPSAKFAWLGEMSAKGFTQGFERGMSNTPTSINNSRADNRQFVVNVQSTGDAVRDIRNQVELYALTFGATS